MSSSKDDNLEQIYRGKYPFTVKDLTSAMISAGARASLSQMRKFCSEHNLRLRSSDKVTLEQFKEFVYSVKDGRRIQTSRSKLQKETSSSPVNRRKLQKETSSSPVNRRSMASNMSHTTDDSLDSSFNDISPRRSAKTLSRKEEKELENIYADEKPLPSNKMAMALRQIGLQPTLQQTRSFQRKENLTQSEYVTFKQFKAFYAHCKGITSNVSKSRNTNINFEEGDRIEADFEGRGRYYKGKIKMKRSDGTYDISYDDGESERRVKASLIRSLESSSSDKYSDNNKLREGDQVEADYAGRGRYFRGKITMCRSDDTYDIRYEDGDSERRVKRNLIRSLEEKNVENHVGNGRDDLEQKQLYALDKFYRDKDIHPRIGKAKSVLKKFKGRLEKLYSGLVSKYGSAPSILLDTPRNISKQNHIFHKGDKVEADFEGRGRYFKGKIKMKHSDGTYDVAYDDGERERRVRAALIRSLDERAMYSREKKQRQSRSSSRSSFGKKSKSRSRSRSNSRSRARRRSSSRSRSRSVSKGEQSLRNGDLVSANYLEKGKYFNGKIVMVHNNDTYDIRYNDGDFERRVHRRDIKLRSKRRNHSRESRKKNRRRRSLSESRSRSRSSRSNSRSRSRGRKRWRSKNYSSSRSRSRRSRSRSFSRSRSRSHSRRSRSRSHSRRSRSRSRSVNSQKSTKSNTSNSTTSSLRSQSSYKENIEIGMFAQVREYNRRGRWLEAKITRVRYDDTFDVEYTKTRRSERKVDRSRIKIRERSLSNDSRKSKSSDSQELSDSSERLNKFRMFEKVKIYLDRRDRRVVKPKSRNAKKFNGTIVKLNSDGTFDVSIRIQKKTKSTGKLKWKKTIKSHIRKQYIKKNLKSKELRRPLTLKDLKRRLGSDMIRDYQALFEKYSSSKKGREVKMSTTALQKIFILAGVPEKWAFDRAYHWTSSFSEISENDKKKKTKHEIKLVDFIHAIRYLEDPLMKGKLFQRLQRKTKVSMELEPGNWHNEQWALSIGEVTLKAIESAFVLHSIIKKSTLSKRGKEKKLNSNTKELKDSTDSLSKQNDKKYMKKKKEYNNVATASSDSDQDEHLPVKLRLPVRRLLNVLLLVAPNDDRLTSRRIKEYASYTGVSFEKDVLAISECAKAFHYLCLDATLFGVTIGALRNSPRRSNTHPGFVEPHVKNALPPLSTLAAHIFAEHGLRGIAKNPAATVRQLSVGRPQPQVDALMRLLTEFQTLDPEKLGEIPISHVGTILNAMGWDPRPLRSQISIFNTQISAMGSSLFSLPEFVSAFGFLLEKEGGDGFTVASAFAFLRVQQMPRDVTIAANTALTYINNILKQPKNESLYVINSRNAAFVDRIGKFEGGIALMNAIGFRGVTDSEGNPCMQFYTRDMNSSTMRELKAKKDRILTEMAVGDGAESIADVVRVVRETHSADEVREAVETLIEYVNNVLQNPSSSSALSVSSRSPLFQQRIGRLRGGDLLMGACGFYLIPEKKPPVYILRGAGMSQSIEKQMSDTNDKSLEINEEDEKNDTNPIIPVVNKSKDAEFRFPSLKLYMRRFLGLQKVRLQQELNQLRIEARSKSKSKPTKPLLRSTYSFIVESAQKKVFCAASETYDVKPEWGEKKKTDHQTKVQNKFKKTFQHLEKKTSGKQSNDKSKTSMQDKPENRKHVEEKHNNESKEDRTDKQSEKNAGIPLGCVSCDVWKETIEQVCRRHKSTILKNEETNSLSAYLDTNGNGYIVIKQFLNFIFSYNPSNEIAPDIDKKKNINDGIIYNSEIRELGAKDPKYKKSVVFSNNNNKNQDSQGSDDDLQWVATNPVQKQQLEMIRKAFLCIDLNNDGIISQDDLKQSFQQRGIASSPDAIALWIRDRDLSGDGTVTFDEFVASFGGLLMPTLDGGEVKPKETQNISDLKSNDYYEIVSVVQYIFSTVRLTNSLAATARATETVLSWIDRILLAPKVKKYWSTSSSDPTFVRAFAGLNRGILLLRGVGFVPEQNKTVWALSDVPSGEAIESWDDEPPATVMERLRRIRQELRLRLKFINQPDVADMSLSVAVASLGSDADDSSVIQWLSVCEFAHEMLIRILHDKSDKTFRIEMNSPKFKKAIGKSDGGMNLLIALGFREGFEGELIYDLPREIAHARKVEFDAGIGALRKRAKLASARMLERLQKEKTNDVTKQKKVSKKKKSKDIGTPMPTIENSLTKKTKLTEKKNKKVVDIDSKKSLKKDKEILRLRDEVQRLQTQLHRTLLPREIAVLNRLPPRKRSAFIKEATAAGLDIGLDLTDMTDTKSGKPKTGKSAKSKASNASRQGMGKMSFSVEIVSEILDEIIYSVAVAGEDRIWHRAAQHAFEYRQVPRSIFSSFSIFDTRLEHTSGTTKDFPSTVTALPGSGKIIITHSKHLHRQSVDSSSVLVLDEGVHAIVQVRRHFNSLQDLNNAQRHQNDNKICGVVGRQLSCAILKDPQLMPHPAVSILQQKLIQNTSKKFTWNEIAKLMFPSNEDIQDEKRTTFSFFRGVFESYDIDKDGRLNLEEVCSLCRELDGREPSAEALKSLKFLPEQRGKYNENITNLRDQSSDTVDFLSLFQWRISNTNATSGDNIAYLLESHLYDIFKSCDTKVVTEHEVVNRSTFLHTAREDKNLLRIFSMVPKAEDILTVLAKDRDLHMKWLQVRHSINLALGTGNNIFLRQPLTLQVECSVNESCTCVRETVVSDFNCEIICLMTDGTVQMWDGFSNRKKRSFRVLGGVFSRTKLARQESIAEVNTELQSLPHIKVLSCERATGVIAINSVFFNGVIRFFDTQTGEMLSGIRPRVPGTEEGSLGIVQNVQPILFKHNVALCSVEKSSILFVVSADDGTLLAELQGHGGINFTPVFCYVPDVGHVVSGGTGGGDFSLRIWNLSGELFWRISSRKRRRLRESGIDWNERKLLQDAMEIIVNEFVDTRNTNSPMEKDESINASRIGTIISENETCGSGVCIKYDDGEVDTGVWYDRLLNPSTHENIDTPILGDKVLVIPNQPRQQFMGRLLSEIDTLGTGGATRTGLRDLLINRLGLPLTDEHITELFDCLETQTSEGHINYSDMLHLAQSYYGGAYLRCRGRVGDSEIFGHLKKRVVAAMKPRGVTPSLLWKTFQSNDIDNITVLSIKIFCRLLHTETELKLSDAEQECILARYGRYKDSVVCYGEFCDSLDNFAKPLLLPFKRAVTGHTAAITAIAFLPVAGLIASASYDGSVRLWDPITRQQRLTLPPHVIQTIPHSESIPQSRFIGVSWDQKSNSWRATLKTRRGDHRGETKKRWWKELKSGNVRPQNHIGVYKSEVEAARAYDDAARHHHGQYALTNFNEDGALPVVEWTSLQAYDECMRIVEPSKGKVCTDLAVFAVSTAKTTTGIVTSAKIKRIAHAIDMDNDDTSVRGYLYLYEDGRLLVTEVPPKHRFDSTYITSPPIANTSVQLQDKANVAIRRVFYITIPSSSLKSISTVQDLRNMLLEANVVHRSLEEIKQVLVSPKVHIVAFFKENDGPSQTIPAIELDSLSNVCKQDAPVGALEFLTGIFMINNTKGIQRCTSWAVGRTTLKSAACEVDIPQTKEIIDSSKASFQHYWQAQLGLARAQLLSRRKLKSQQSIEKWKLYQEIASQFHAVSAAEGQASDSNYRSIFQRALRAPTHSNVEATAIDTAKYLFNAVSLGCTIVRKGDILRALKTQQGSICEAIAVGDKLFSNIIPSSLSIQDFCQIAQKSLFKLLSASEILSLLRQHRNVFVTAQNGGANVASVVDTSVHALGQTGTLFDEDAFCLLLRDTSPLKVLSDNVQEVDKCTKTWGEVKEITKFNGDKEPLSPLENYARSILSNTLSSKLSLIADAFGAPIRTTCDQVVQMVLQDASLETVDLQQNINSNEFPDQEVTDDFIGDGLFYYYVATERIIPERCSMNIDRCGYEAWGWTSLEGEDKGTVATHACLVQVDPNKRSLTGMSQEKSLHEILSGCTTIVPRLFTNANPMPHNENEFSSRFVAKHQQSLGPISHRLLMERFHGFKPLRSVLPLPIPAHVDTLKLWGRQILLAIQSFHEKDVAMGRGSLNPDTLLVSPDGLRLVLSSLSAAADATAVSDSAIHAQSNEMKNIVENEAMPIPAQFCALDVAFFGCLLVEILSGASPPIALKLSDSALQLAFGAESNVSDDSSEILVALRMAAQAVAPTQMLLSEGRSIVCATSLPPASDLTPLIDPNSKTWRPAERLPSSVSGVLHIIALCLQQDWKNRPSIKTLLSHPFFKANKQNIKVCATTIAPHMHFAAGRAALQWARSYIVSPMQALLERHRLYEKIGNVSGWVYLVEKLTAVLVDGNAHLVHELIVNDNILETTTSVALQYYGSKWSQTVGPGSGAGFILGEQNSSLGERIIRRAAHMLKQLFNSMQQDTTCVSPLAPHVGRMLHCAILLFTGDLRIGTFHSGETSLLWDPFIVECVRPVMEDIITSEGSGNNSLKPLCDLITMSSMDRPWIKSKLLLKENLGGISETSNLMFRQDYLGRLLLLSSLLSQATSLDVDSRSRTSAITRITQMLTESFTAVSNTNTLGNKNKTKNASKREEFRCKTSSGFANGGSVALLFVQTKVTHKLLPLMNIQDSQCRRQLFLLMKCATTPTIRSFCTPEQSHPWDILADEFCTRSYLTCIYTRLASNEAESVQNTRLLWKILDNMATRGGRYTRFWQNSGILQLLVQSLHPQPREMSQVSKVVVPLAEGVLRNIKRNESPTFLKNFSLFFAEYLQNDDTCTKKEDSSESEKYLVSIPDCCSSIAEIEKYLKDIHFNGGTIEEILRVSTDLSFVLLSWVENPKIHGGSDEMVLLEQIFCIFRSKFDQYWEDIENSTNENHINLSTQLIDSILNLLFQLQSWDKQANKELNPSNRNDRNMNKRRNLADVAFVGAGFSSSLSKKIKHGLESSMWMSLLPIHAKITTLVSVALRNNSEDMIQSFVHSDLAGHFTGALLAIHRLLDGSSKKTHKYDLQGYPILSATTTALVDLWSGILHAGNISVPSGELLGNRIVECGAVSIIIDDMLPDLRSYLLHSDEPMLNPKLRNKNKGKKKNRSAWKKGARNKYSPVAIQSKSASNPSTSVCFLDSPSPAAFPIRSFSLQLIEEIATTVATGGRRPPLAVAPVVKSLVAHLHHGDVIIVECERLTQLAAEKKAQENTGNLEDTTKSDCLEMSVARFLQAIISTGDQSIESKMLSNGIDAPIEAFDLNICFPGHLTLVENAWRQWIRIKRVSFDLVPLKDYKHNQSPNTSIEYTKSSYSPKIENNIKNIIENDLENNLEHNVEKLQTLHYPGMDPLPENNNDNKTDFEKETEAQKRRLNITSSHTNEKMDSPEIKIVKDTTSESNDADIKININDTIDENKSKNIKNEVSRMEDFLSELGDDIIGVKEVFDAQVESFGSKNQRILWSSVPAVLRKLQKIPDVDTMKKVKSASSDTINLYNAREKSTKKKYKIKDNTELSIDFYQFLEILAKSESIGDYSEKVRISELKADERAIPKKTQKFKSVTSNKFEGGVGTTGGGRFGQDEDDEIQMDAYDIDIIQIDRKSQKKKRRKRKSIEEGKNADGSSSNSSSNSDSSDSGENYKNGRKHSSRKLKSKGRNTDVK